MTSRHGTVQGQGDHHHWGDEAPLKLLASSMASKGQFPRGVYFCLALGRWAAVLA